MFIVSSRCLFGYSVGLGLGFVARPLPFQCYVTQQGSGARCQAGSGSEIEVVPWIAATLHVDWGNASWLKRIRFRMETNTSVRESIRPSISQMRTSISLSIPGITWLRFMWKGQVFQFCALPFGPSLSLWIFTKVSRELCSALHLWGMRVRMYLDDWLVLAQLQDLCHQNV